MLVVNPLPYFSLSSTTLENLFLSKCQFFFVIIHIRKIIGTLGEVHCCVILCFHSLVYFISVFKEKILCIPDAIPIAILVIQKYGFTCYQDLSHTCILKFYYSGCTKNHFLQEVFHACVIIYSPSPPRKTSCRVVDL